MCLNEYQTVSSSYSPSSVYIRLYTHGKRFVLLKARLYKRVLSRSELHQAQNSGDIAAIKSKAVYMRDIAVANQSATKIASSCATKIACVNAPLKSE